MATKKTGRADAAKPARAKKAAASAEKPAARAKKPAATKRTAAKRKPAAPSHEAIATRAYFLALESGTGDELHNWLRAEDELTTRS